jgi:hypothetical protein
MMAQADPDLNSDEAGFSGEHAAAVERYQNTGVEQTDNVLRPESPDQTEIETKVLDDASKTGFWLRKANGCVALALPALVAVTGIVLSRLRPHCHLDSNCKTRPTRHWQVRPARPKPGPCNVLPMPPARPLATRLCLQTTVPERQWLA